MKVCSGSRLMVAANILFVLELVFSADAADSEMGHPAVQASTSPGLFSAVEESADLSPHGNDRHYVNGVKFAYITGSLCDNRGVFD